MAELVRKPPLIGAVRGRNVTLEPSPARSMATVIARPGQARDLAARVADLHGLDLPEGPRRSGGDPFFVGVGPGAWLAVSARPGVAETLRRDLAGLASVADQSSAYAVMRLSGEGAPRLLARRLPIDLHPRAFGPGDAAVANIGLINAVLWRTDDPPIFEIGVFRSYAEEMWDDFSRSIEAERAA